MIFLGAAYGENEDTTFSNKRRDPDIFPYFNGILDLLRGSRTIDKYFTTKFDP